MRIHDEDWVKNVWSSEKKVEKTHWKTKRDMVREYGSRYDGTRDRQRRIHDRKKWRRNVMKRKSNRI